MMGRSIEVECNRCSLFCAAYCRSEMLSQVVLLLAAALCCAAATRTIVLEV